MPDEIERRYVVSAMETDLLRYPHRKIEQGYFDTPPSYSFRVRLVDGKTAKLNRKIGAGLVRDEQEKDCEYEAGRFIFDSCPHRLYKTRYLRDGWEIDIFHAPLAGLVLAEKEMASVDELVVIPLWLIRTEEVTDSLTNQHLAWLATELLGLKDLRPDVPVRDLLPKRLPRIVFTGGPCSGKSTTLEAFRIEFASQVMCVPEAATIVIGQIGAKPPIGDGLGMRLFQRTLMRTQANFEAVSELQAWRDSKRAVIVDRGTVDGAAYLAGGMKEFEDVCRTVMATEYARYDLVLCFETPPQDVYEANCRNNPARRETYAEAADLGARIQNVWASHPGFRLVRNGVSWEDKLAGARREISAFLAGK